MMGAIKKFRTVILAVIVVLVIAGLSLGTFLYIHIFAPNVNLDDKQSVLLFIPTGSSYDDVMQMLEQEGIVSNIKRFERLAQRKNYPNRVMPGRYRIQNRMSNNSLVNLLRSGEQEPVRLTFTNIRTEEELASSIAAQLELDSVTMLNHLMDEALIESAGFTAPSLKPLFIPNTYEVYWTSSAPQLISRMQREYDAFWNESRIELARQIGRSPEEIITLASIVQSETNRVDEMPRIAGVYINRLRVNMPLQADPTIVYAIGDFSINRVLNHHLTFDSPYNTYLYPGLPPGPINLPEPRTIDAVLNHEIHNYFYFSAKPDFSGYHVFARTYNEHLRNARRYQQALNERRIFR